MGKRGRAAGFTNAMAKAASAKRRDRDEEAHAIASEVYAAVLDARPVSGRAPLWMMGPLLYIAEMAAPAVVKTHELPADDAEDVAAYLMHGQADLLMSMVGGFDREHFAKWRGEQEAAQKDDGADATPVEGSQ